MCFTMQSHLGELWRVSLFTSFNNCIVGNHNHYSLVLVVLLSVITSVILDSACRQQLLSSLGCVLVRWVGFFGCGSGFSNVESRCRSSFSGSVFGFHFLYTLYIYVYIYTVIISSKALRSLDPYTTLRLLYYTSSQIPAPHHGHNQQLHRGDDLTYTSPHKVLQGAPRPNYNGGQYSTPNSDIQATHYS